MPAPFERFDLTGRTALITGGATGLGYAMSRGLARAGAKIVIAARREDVLKSAVDTLNQDPLVKDAEWYRVDLTSRDSIQELIEHVNSHLGGVDIFVGNAGGTYPQLLPDVDMGIADEAFQLNLMSNLQLANAFLPKMKAQRWGRIIFTSSLASVMSLPGHGVAVYGATKAAVNGLARGIAADMGASNITANALQMGFFHTDIMSDITHKVEAAVSAEAAENVLKAIANASALGRLGEPAEVEGIVQLLASEAGSFITGASIPVDGGMSIVMFPDPLGS